MRSPERVPRASHRVRRRRRPPRSRPRTASPFWRADSRRERCLRFAFPSLAGDDAAGRADRARRRCRPAGPSRAGAASAAWASDWKDSAISASPVSTARGSPNALWTEGRPRRVAASSKHGRSSWTSEAQCRNSIAAAAAPDNADAVVSAGARDRQAQTRAGSARRRETPRSAWRRAARGAPRRRGPGRGPGPAIARSGSSHPRQPPADNVTFNCHI